MVQQFGSATFFLLWYSYHQRTFFFAKTKKSYKELLFIMSMCHNQKTTLCKILCSLILPSSNDRKPWFNNLYELFLFSLKTGHCQNLRENWDGKQSFFFQIDNGLIFSFFSYKTFLLFFKIESFRFSLKLNFMEPRKISTQSDIQ